MGDPQENPPKSSSVWGWLYDHTIGYVVSLLKWLCQWAFIIAVILIIVGIVMFLAGGGTTLASIGAAAPVALPVAAAGFKIFIVGVVFLIYGLICWLVGALK